MERNRPENMEKTGRNNKGQFAPGKSGNPGGRPPIPKEFREFGAMAPARLRQIADDPRTPVKVRADIEKWFAEMCYGKPSQRVDMDANLSAGPVTIRLEGQLDEWAQ